MGQEDDAGVGEHPGGFAFGDGGESAKQGAVLPTLAPRFGTSPGAVPPFRGSEACSPGLIAHLSPKWSDSLPNHLPRQPSECRADCCLAGRERGGGEADSGPSPAVGKRCRQLPCCSLAVLARWGGFSSELRTSQLVSLVCASLG